MQQRLRGQRVAVRRRAAAYGCLVLGNGLRYLHKREDRAGALAETRLAAAAVAPPTLGAFLAPSNLQGLSPATDRNCAWILCVIWCTVNQATQPGRFVRRLSL